MDVSNGIDVGVSVKVAVSCGIGLGVSEAGNGSVGRNEGMSIVLSAVGVEYVPHNVGDEPQAVNNMEAMNRMDRRRFTVNPSGRLYPP